MTTISIKHNINQVLPQIREKMSAKNMKFAVAKTLTNLAQESQAQVRREMPQKFTLRRKWVVGGIRIKPAARDRLEAVVYSLDSGGRRDFMTRQEFGGIKTAEGGSHVAVPLKAVQPNKSKLIPDVLKPKSLLGTPIQRTIKRTGRVLVVSASGYKAMKVKGKKAGNEYILIKRGGKYVPAWLLTPRATIKRQMFLTDATRKVVNARASILLRKNAIEALTPCR